MKMKTRLNKKERDLVGYLARSSDHTVHPNYYTGTGRWARRGANDAGRLAGALDKLGLVQGKHYITGNDAPRGGWTGEFVHLLPLGRRRKYIRNLRHETCTPQPAPVAPQPDPAPEPVTLDADRQQALFAWMADGALHPCPDNVLAIKQESGLSWSVLETVFKPATY